MRVEECGKRSVSREEVRVEECEKRSASREGVASRERSGRRGLRIQKECE